MKEPADAVVLAARLARAFPSLSTNSAAALAEELCRIERAQHRHAERCCNGEYRCMREKPYAHLGEPGYYESHDPDAEERAAKRIRNRVAAWRKRLDSLRYGSAAVKDATELGQNMVTLQGDPRGPVLLLRLPGEQEAKAV